MSLWYRASTISPTLLDPRSANFDPTLSEPPNGE